MNYPSAGTPSYGEEAAQHYKEQAGVVDRFPTVSGDNYKGLYEQTDIHFTKALSRLNEEIDRLHARLEPILDGDIQEKAGPTDAVSRRNPADSQFSGMLKTHHELLELLTSRLISLSDRIHL